MDSVRTYKVLIVEDNPRCAGPIRDRLERDEKYKVLDVTGSAFEAYTLTKVGLPDIIIVDLQLEEGSGVSLLHRLRDPQEHLPIRPYILVITSFTADTMMERIGSGLADFAFQKTDGLVDPDQIVEHLFIMESMFFRNRKPQSPPIDSTVEKVKLIRIRIESELSQYHIVQGSKGLDYLRELLYLAAIQPEHKKLRLTPLFNQMAIQFQNTPHNIDMGIRRALRVAFTKTNPDDLKRVYTAYLSAEYGAPPAKEFVAYTIEKFRREQIIPIDE